MKTAEELKQSAKHVSWEIPELMYADSDYYLFTESELDAYAEQVAKEAFVEARKVVDDGSDIWKWKDYNELIKQQSDNTKP